MLVSEQAERAEAIGESIGENATEDDEREGEEVKAIDESNGESHDEKETLGDVERAHNAYGKNAPSMVSSNGWHALLNMAGHAQEWRRHGK